jgi:hypothetical protein
MIGLVNNKLEGMGQKSAHNGEVLLPTPACHAQGNPQNPQSGKLVYKI